MTRAHILYISGFSQWGGSTISLLRRIEKLDSDGFRVTVVVPEVGPMVRKFEDAGARVEILRMAVLLRFRALRDILKYLVSFVPSVSRIYLTIKRHDVDVVHSNDSIVLVGGIAAKLAGVPSITHVRDDVKEPGWVIRLRNTIVSLFSDRVLAVSKAVQEDFVAYGGNRAKSRVLYNGIDINFFKPKGDGSGLKRSFSIPPDAKVVAHIGRMDPNKGQEVLVNSASAVLKSIPSAYFLFVGDVNASKFQWYKERLGRIIEEKGLRDRIIFAGRQDDIQEIINFSDVVVLPSAYDAHPGVICEASSCGKPVVASRVGGVPEMVKDRETGYLIPPHDVEALADSLVRVLSDEQSATKMGMAGRKYMMERFDINKLTDELVGIYEDLSGNGSMT